MENFLEQFGLSSASIALGAAVACFAWTLVAILTYPKSRLDQDQSSFERDRRAKLRTGSAIYRWFEPLMHEIARKWRVSGGLKALQKNLVVAAEPLPWTAEEFLATKLLEGLMIAVAFLSAATLLGYFVAGILLALPIATFYPTLYSKTIRDRAARRLRRLRIRLPFAVDLIALMMQAGASFQESLETVVNENKNHPVGEELSEVLRQVALGRTRAEALRALQSRLDDADISELVFAINKGEELGTPLSTILRDQADQMRLKRSQWGEKAAAEAEIKLVFPGMVVMVACLLVVIAPIVLPAALSVL